LTTFSADFMVEDPIGLHARPAGQLVKLVQESKAEIFLGRPNTELTLIRGPLALLALKVHRGETLRVEVTGTEKELALALIDKVQEILRG
jgi:phosphocarrier protein HPr